MARSSTTRPKGSGIPAKGKGWGGPAKGASASRIDAGEAGDAIRAQRWDPAKLADAAAVEAEMMGVLYTHALGAENEHARIAAADKMLDRLKGKPKQATDVTSGGAPITIITGVPRAADEP